MTSAAIILTMLATAEPALPQVDVGAEPKPKNTIIEFLVPVRIQIAGDGSGMSAVAAIEGEPVYVRLINEKGQSVWGHADRVLVDIENKKTIFDGNAARWHIKKKRFLSVGKADSAAVDLEQPIAPGEE